MSPHIPDTVLEWILAVAGGSTLIIFGLALQHFFVQPAILTRSQRLFQDVSVLIGLTHGSALLLLNSATDLWAGVGTGMYMVAMALFLSAIEAARRTALTRTFVYEPRCTSLVSTGPYRVIRHPIYLAYSLAWLAAPVATHNWPLGLTAVFMIACYVISAREEERQLSTGPLAAQFRTYAAGTWRMIPFVY